MPVRLCRFQSRQSQAILRQTAGNPAEILRQAACNQQEN